MALRTCPDCGRDCSDLAPACPNCGRPCTPAVRTIEATGKRYKAIQGIAVLLILVGVIALIAGGGNVAHVSFLVGIPLYIYGRAGGWWHHG